MMTSLRKPALAPLYASAVSLALLGSPTLAQTPTTPSEGGSLMEDGMRLFWRGLMNEMEPTLDEMGKALEEIRPSLEKMGPQLRELVSLMGDVGNYGMPERLPNGDILIRRTAPLDPKAIPPSKAPSIGRPGANGEIEL